MMLRKISPFKKFGRTSEQASSASCEFSLAQIAPDEILIELLRPLTQVTVSMFLREYRRETCTWQYAIFMEDLASDTSESPQSYVARHLVNLLNAIQVCRSWNQAGTRLLYRALFLATPTSIHLLSRTFRDNPTLCDLVQEVYLPHAVKPHNNTNTTRSRLFGGTLRDWRLPRLTKELSQALRMCTQLRRLMFFKGRNRFDTKLESVIVELFLHRESPASHIRHLCIKGCDVPISPLFTTPTPPMHSPLPNLESLELINVRFVEGGNPGLPFLPHLSSLTITNEKSVPKSAYLRFDIQSNNLPALRRMKLHNFYLANSADGTSLGQIEELDLHGAHALNMIQTWAPYYKRCQIGNLERLGLSMDYCQEHGFLDVRFPPKMRSLDLRLLYPSDLGAREPTALIELLQKIRLAKRDFGTFEKVTLFLAVDDLEQRICLDGWLGNVQSECRAVGVECAIRDIPELYTRWKI